MGLRGISRTTLVSISLQFYIKENNKKGEGTVLGCHEFMIWEQGYTDTMYIKVKIVAVRGRALLYSPRKNVIIKHRWEKTVDTGFKF